MTKTKTTEFRPPAVSRPRPLSPELQDWLVVVVVVVVYVVVVVVLDIVINFYVGLLTDGQTNAG